MAFVHHTVSANDYTAQDSAGIVLSICKYHRDSNGWNDIGYNFLVDRFGQIFEGRAGGIDQAVIGAQAEGYNRFSTGVANLGTFSSVPQSPEAIDALGRLIGWKLAVHGVPVSGTVTVTSGGGSTNRYPSGTAVTFQRISGHRDGCSTECPGNALYAQLQAIRDRAAKVSPTVARVARLSILAAEAVVPYGDDARFSGQLTGTEGNPVGGVRVNLQKRGPSGKFTTIARSTTKADGSFDVQARWRATGVVRVTARPAAGAASVRSPRVSVKMTRAVTATAATSRIQAGRTIAVSGTVRPNASLRVLVERDVGGGRYEKVADVPVRVRRSRFAARLRLRRPGLYRLTAHTSKKAGDVQAPPLFVRAVRDIERNPPREAPGGATSEESGAATPSADGTAPSSGGTPAA